jgi:hypothetical protein
MPAKFTKTLIAAIMATLSLTLALPAQAAKKAKAPPPDLYQAPSSFQGKVAIIPIGFVFEGRIQGTIGSSVSRAGERFAIEVSAPVMANGTEVLIPSGSQIIGEVVEAISSSRQPHEKDMPRPLGKLRTQLMSIKLPDGATYPVVASLAPDASAGKKGTDGLKSRSSSVAYVGSEAGFNAVNPALQNRYSRDRNGKIAVLKRDQILKDAILGEDSSHSKSAGGGSIRALIKRNRDLYILDGSSLCVKLDAPLKISYAASAAQASIEASHMREFQEGSNSSSSSGRRFSKNRKQEENPGEENLAPVAGKTDNLDNRQSPKNSDTSSANDF